MIDDKRKYLRFECLVPVEEIQSEGMNGTAREVALDNVSREGARLVMDVDTPFTPGSNVKLRISLSPDKNPIFIRGSVMWSRMKGDKYEIGVRILDMDSAAKAELLDIGFERWKDEQTPSRSGSKG
jgi:PilZ domain